MSTEPPSWQILKWYDENRAWIVLTCCGRKQGRLRSIAYLERGGRYVVCGACRKKWVVERFRRPDSYSRVPTYQYSLVNTYRPRRNATVKETT